MKVYISHRGNLFGPNPGRENHPTYIKKALAIPKLEVEIDVWFTDDGWYLGHDKPCYKTDEDFLSNTRLWIHCKDIITLQKAVAAGFHCFFHQNDDVALTSKKYLWLFPGQPIPDYGMTIAVKPELFPALDISNAGAICSDYILKYKKEPVWKNHKK